jgi:hypothetical protein
MSEKISGAKMSTSGGYWGNCLWKSREIRREIRRETSGGEEADDYLHGMHRVNQSLAPTEAHEGGCDHLTTH